MKATALVFLAALVVGCASVSKNPKDYTWRVEYRDGSANGKSLTAYVEWFDDKTSCVGSVLFVPEVKNVQDAPIRIVRVRDGAEKDFHMCSESSNPDYLRVPPYNVVH
jgi:hypothetical protein